MKKLSLISVVVLAIVFCFSAVYADEPLRIGMSLTGSINDQSWNQAGYEGLMMIKDEMGAEVAFQEQVPLSNVEESLRNYAAQGYDIVIGMGDQYSEAGKVVAEEYPETIFIVMSGIYTGDNLIATAMFDEEIAYVAGVTAALSGGALLGAPLIHDFCLISLSDRLTPWEKIEKRLLAAAEADMVIVLYNPESKSRKGYLLRATDVLMRILPGDRICGIARNIGRDGESKEILVLSDLKDVGADMFSTVFIGNSSTKRCGDYMVTERGYGSER